jgi:type IV pilus assembly protein PilN
VICLAGYSWLQRELEDQKNKNAYLKDSTAKLDLQIKDIAGLQADILALKARQTAVEDLQADRNAPVNLMNELVQQAPDGIYITSMKQEGQSIFIAGVAQSQERVSELLRNFATNSEWLEKPELVEIVASFQAITPKDQRKVYSFTLKAGLVRGVVSKKSSSDSTPNSEVEKR